MGVLGSINSFYFAIYDRLDETKHEEVRCH